MTSLFDNDDKVNAIFNTKTAGKQLVIAKHDVLGKTGEFLFLAHSDREFALRCQMVEREIENAAHLKMSTVSDGKAKLVRALFEEWQLRHANCAVCKSEPKVAGIVVESMAGLNQHALLDSGAKSANNAAASSIGYQDLSRGLGTSNGAILAGGLQSRGMGWAKQMATAAGRKALGKKGQNWVLVHTTHQLPDGTGGSKTVHSMSLGIASGPSGGSPWVLHKFGRNANAQLGADGAYSDEDVSMPGVQVQLVGTQHHFEQQADGKVKWTPAVDLEHRREGSVYVPLNRIYDATPEQSDLNDTRMRTINPSWDRSARCSNAGSIWRRLDFKKGARKKGEGWGQQEPAVKVNECLFRCGTGQPDSGGAYTALDINGAWDTKDPTNEANTAHAQFCHTDKMGPGKVGCGHNHDVFAVQEPGRTGKAAQVGGDGIPLVGGMDTGDDRARAGLRAEPLPGYRVQALSETPFDLKKNNMFDFDPATLGTPAAATSTAFKFGQRIREIARRVNPKGSSNAGGSSKPSSSGGGYTGDIDPSSFTF
jgi:hypothetical protein